MALEIQYAVRDSTNHYDTTIVVLEYKDIARNNSHYEAIAIEE